MEDLIDNTARPKYHFLYLPYPPNIPRKSLVSLEMRTGANHFSLSMPDPNGFILSSCNLGCLTAPGRPIIMISQVHLTCRMNASVPHRISLRFSRPMYRSKTVLGQQFGTFQRQVGQLQSQNSAQTLVAPSYSTYHLHIQTPEGVLRTSCEWHSRRSSRSAQYIAHYRPNTHAFPGFSFPILYSLFAYLIPAYSSILF